MADPAPEEQPKKKKSGLIKYIILVVLLLVLGGGGYFAYLTFFAAKPPAAAPPAEGAAPAEAPKADAHGEAKPAEKKAEGGHGEAKSEAKGGGGHGGGKDKAASNNVPLPPFVVNLADPNARRYLKVVLEVEVTSNPELLEENKAKIRDALLMLLSSKNSQDLSTLEGKILLRKEIVDRLNQAIGQPKVSRVYFTDFVIQ
ncbi:MAG: flagellar basal body-associated protein [Solidesulfovibrio magneticus str. Maddingley MBC34]|uniref:Flagellar protein FliL n=1 Tax=Solidesulfovibrio magneticus str. Maddingley MBC34 TaxID=1206767 RepID=K6H4R8_9BACT|nr:MAG: flagellar basal body-associated protein [Solidesulfovibrio magneticus str. Maddingley MBC34]